MLRPVLTTLLLLSTALPLVACEGTKEQLGLTRRTPDEFAVVQRAPLEMPPDFYLRPPTPGAARPQEQTVEAQAQTAIMGAPRAAKGTSKGESALLQKTGATTQADPTIRSTINAETAAIAAAEKPTVQRILDIGGDTEGKIDGPAPVVDPVAEAQRLKANKQAGKPVTDGVTPTIKK
jgi:hypothetical protein